MLGCLPTSTLLMSLAWHVGSWIFFLFFQLVKRNDFMGEEEKIDSPRCDFLLTSFLLLLLAWFNLLVGVGAGLLFVDLLFFMDVVFCLMVTIPLSVLFLIAFTSFFSRFKCCIMVGGYPSSRTSWMDGSIKSPSMQLSASLECGLLMSG